jgi:hypothetical protein
VNNLTPDNIQVERHDDKPGKVTLRHEGRLLAHREHAHSGWSFMNAPLFSTADLVAIALVAAKVR